uniref:non-specific serine/threonine protein kinase n=1 Tax=Percolomonas cosmopolitus TaxID=63605 RepID=A0A7S1KQW3_9EUKA|mmetsp:Transcript_5728/g.21701  ORF Transcript_5728/g.21701 Transcript_5728/m.21701 type:complete len:1567 (+) Transcript_5728:1481-6181(+)
MGNQIYNSAPPPSPLHLLQTLSLTPTNNAPLSKRGLLKSHKCWQVEDGLCVVVRLYWKQASAGVGGTVLEIAPQLVHNSTGASSAASILTSGSSSALTSSGAGGGANASTGTPSGNTSAASNSLTSPDAQGTAAMQLQGGVSASGTGGSSSNASGSSTTSTAALIAATTTTTTAAAVEEKLIIQQKKKLLELLLKKFHLLRQPNILNYHKITETEKACCLIRQFCYISLTDRISTRPFLSSLNKLWLSYQILQALAQLREAQFYHGDVKLTNVLLTAWDWVLLSDLAIHKPLYLPADNPSTFAVFFSNVEGSAFLAPERFYDHQQQESTTTSTTLPSATISTASSSSSSSPVTTTTTKRLSAQISDQQLLEHTLLSVAEDGTTGSRSRSHSTASNSSARSRSSSSPKCHAKHTAIASTLHAMDVFSAGCVIAQLFLDVRALFNFEQLLAYRNGHTTHLEDTLGKIQNAHLREMIRHMLQVDPEKRLSAEEYCAEWTPKLFPRFFAPLHQIISTMVTDTCDERIERLYLVYNMIVERIMMASEEEISPSKVSVQQDVNDETTKTSSKENPTSKHSSKGSFRDWTPIVEEIIHKSRQDISQLIDLHPVGCSYHDELLRFKSPLQMEGMEIITSVVCASVRKAEKVENRVRGLQLIQSLAHHSTNYIRLQRLIPYTCTLLSDQAPLVRITAIQTLAIVLKNIESFPISESNLFSDYILDKLKKLASDESEMVCVCFAEHLPFFATHAKRFLDISMRFKSKHSLSLSQSATSLKEETYEESLTKLHTDILQMVVHLSMHPCVFVKIGLLENIVELCQFYGIGKTNEQVLPMIITFLNARPWRLRYAFFQKIVPISKFVGKVSLQHFILPCILQAIYDSSEPVIEQALADFVLLCEAQLFKKSTIIELAQRISPLLHHPNIWIRSTSASFMSVASQQLGPVDSACFLLDILTPHLNYRILNLTEENIRQCVKLHLDRSVCDKAVKLKPENFHAMDQLKMSEDLNVYGSWTSVLGSRSLTQEDAEILELMRPYLLQYSTVQSTKIMDPMDQQDNTPAPSQVIDLDVEPHILPHNMLGNQGNSSHHFTAGRERTSSNSHPYEQVEKLCAQAYPSLTKKELAAFRPRGDFCGQSHPHESAVTCISVHVSLKWFATASKDYTVRVWDLDKSYVESALIARMTYNVDREFGHVNTVIVFSEAQEESFMAFGTSNGWMHIVDANSGLMLHRIQLDKQGESTHYTALDDYHTSSPQPSINVTHYVNLNGVPFVLCGSQSGIITALNARTGRQEFKLQSQFHLQEGSITALCGENTWIVSGTNRGFLTLWDLRFQLPASNWRLSSDLCLAPSSGVSALGVKQNDGMAPWIYIATRSRDVVLWHLESHREARIFRVGNPLAKVKVKNALNIPKKSADPVDFALPSANGDGDLIRDESLTLHTQDPYAEDEWPDIEWNKLKQIEVTCMHVNPDGSFFTGSSDRFVRYWNPDAMNLSRVVSGLPSYERARYHCANRFPPIYEEIIFQNQSEMESVRKAMPMFEMHKNAECHPDAITDVKVVSHGGVPMLLTASRDGTLMLWR